ncbi:nuclear transport factor 2 family protein [Terrimonas alba]|uniref:nuclear transport factor 2 family protein n=1 Tax=Terrimonas alba TaxID=3349636 RepID=UPI0035F39315
MKKQTLIIALFGGLLGFCGCNSKTTDNTSQTQTKSQEMTITVETMKQVLDGFNRHDVDAIMEFFSDDCSLDLPKGPEPWGQRLIGKAQVREGLAGRFKGIPDVQYGEDLHWISADGTRGVSEWTLTGTTTSGVKLKVRGCDLWEFRNGKITRKNSYWKIVE